MNNNELFLNLNFDHEALDNRFEGHELGSEFNADITLDNVNPNLLIATYTGATVA